MPNSHGSNATHDRTHIITHIINIIINIIIKPYYIAVDRLTFPCIDSGEEKMLFFDTPFKLFLDLLDPPP